MDAVMMPVVRALRVRAVRVPMREPHRTASGVVSESPLVLVDAMTDGGVTGHAILFTYTAAALRPVADLIVNMEPLVAGEYLAPAAIADKLAERYGNSAQVQLRYTASQAITVYSPKVDQVRRTQNELAELGKKGIAFNGDGQRTEFLFTKLNDIKPAMIEEATRKAREVAAKFAADSNSKLGKIRSANQGQFTVSDRDSNTPHIKNVRVVATVEYYLSD